MARTRADLVRERRRALGLTQMQLAEACGYRSHGVIAKLESGKRPLLALVDAHLRVARVLRIHPNLLLDWETDEDGQPLTRDSTTAEVSA